MPERTEARSDRGVTRRTIAHTAWSAPALVMLPTARARAASCQSLPNVAFKGSWGNAVQSSGWGSAGGGLGFFAYGGQNVFGALRDPAVLGLGGTATITTSITLTLAANTTYVMAFPVASWYVDNARTATLTISGPGPTYSRSTDVASPGVVNYQFTTGASPTVTITVQVGLSIPVLLPASGDDILLASPTLSCGSAAPVVSRRQVPVPEVSRAPVTLTPSPGTATPSSGTAAPSPTSSPRSGAATPTPGS